MKSHLIQWACWLVALLLLPLAAARADSISVAAPAGVGVVAVDGNDAQCSLREAMLLANGAAANSDCMLVVDSHPALTIVLPSNALFTLTDAPYTSTADPQGPNGLPVVAASADTATYTISGNGATITRATTGGTPQFRLLQVTASGDLTVNDVIFSHGHSLDGSVSSAGGHGGAIYNAGSLTLDGCTVRDNTTGAGGTGVSGVNGGNGGPGGSGGGMYNVHMLTLTHTTVSNNTTGVGGAGDAGSGGADGAAGDGAGLAVADTSSFTTVLGSTFSGNATPGHGGAIFVRDGQVVVGNSTLVGNLAGSGGGVYMQNDSGNAIASLGYDTINANTGGALAGSLYAVEMDHSIVADATLACSTTGLNVTSAGYNFVSDASCALSTSGDQENVDPKLKPLADNGGLTLSLLPKPTSPVIDAIPSYACTVISPMPSGVAATDQRGEPRPQGAGCDVGAVELPALVTTFVSYGGSGQHALAGDPFAWPLTVQATDAQGGAVAGLSVAILSPLGSASASCTPNITDATGVLLAYCTANAQIGSYTISLSVPATRSRTGAALNQDFNLTNDYNDRIFGDGFDGSPLATASMAAGQNVADIAVTVPSGLLAGRIVPILVVHDANGHRVSMVEARRSADGTRVRTIDYDARGYPAHFGAWHLPASPHLQLRVERQAGVAQTSLRASPQ